jgi:predicted metal-dependent hydrolase
VQPTLPFDATFRSPSLAGERSGSENPVARPNASRYEFVRHPKARRYIIRVAENGVVRVTLPRWGSKREAEAFAERERGWIEKQQRRAQAERERREHERQRATTNGESAERPLSADEQRALRVRATNELPPRLLELAAQHALAVSRVSVRNQLWRWGSCNRNGHICLNWRLVTMPDWVRDYVMVHELMHLKRMDHSPKFWRLVADACPEYKAARAWLRTNARAESRT